MQHQFLHPPVRELSDVQRVVEATIDRVDEPELFRLLARSSKLADDSTVELEFVDRRIVHSVGVAGVGAVEIRVRCMRDAEGGRDADVGDLRLDVASAVEDLY